MKIMIEVSVGDFIDRLSILEIKKSNGLEVDIELTQYIEQLPKFDQMGLEHYRGLLFAINSRLWILEDQKRKFHDRTLDEYANLAELITQLNDLRYATKKKADHYFNSSLSEQKSHK